MFTNEQNMGLLQRSWVEETVYKVVSHWLSGKDKVLDAAVSKEVDDIDSFLE